ncbi:MAG: VWA domain-containing protein [Deltaproteobacteria bacterium]|nr:MAG: VWA domain-containing protein [Deltaproteobacteria bacterium]
MPILDPNKSMTLHTVTGSRYGFSATRVDQLGASEWTLVAIVCDVSGSVGAFQKEMEAAIQSIVEACRLSPRADHLMLRTVAFDDRVREVHGFKPLSDCHPKDYDGALAIGGTTALYDAAHNAVAATVQYGSTLAKRGMAVNAILFVITDGGDNASTVDAGAVKHAIAHAVKSEALESVQTMLIGVDVDTSGVGAYLMDFSAKAGFDHYLGLADATPRTLAGLADFVSQSIAAQSMYLGTGLSATLGSI